MMVMYKSAFLTTRQPEHIEKLKRCYYWFLGHNDLNISLYDKETKGCNDGIEQDGANRNQGAESTISWLLARLLMRKLIWKTWTIQKSFQRAPAEGFCQ